MSADESVSYFAAKSAVISFTKGMGLDKNFQAKEGLVFKTLCPTFANTEIVTGTKDVLE